MNNKRIRKFFLMFFFSIIMVVMETSVYIKAAPAEQNSGLSIEDLTFHDEKLYKNEVEQDLKFTFSYEKEDTKFYLIAPDKRVIDPTSPQADLTANVTKKGMEVIVRNAMSGQWMLRYRKASKEKLSVTVEQYEQELEITEFQIDSIEEAIVNYSFRTAYARSKWFTYSIYLNKSPKLDENAKLLFSSEGYTGKKIHGSILLSGAGTGEFYYLILKVDMGNQKDSPVIANSKCFSYAPETTLEQYEGFTVSADEITGKLTITWDWEALPWIQKLRVTEEEDGVLHFARDFDRTQNFCVIDTLKEREQSKITVTIFDGEEEAVSDERIVNWTKTGQFRIVRDGGERRNNDQWSYQYCNAKSQKLIQTVNGVSKTLVLDGDGEEVVSLTSESCPVELKYVDKNGIEWIRERYVLRDEEAPNVEFTEDYSGYVTDASEVVIEGVTEHTATVMLNDQTLIVGSDGRFQGTLSLQFGENSWKLEVTDTAGNVSVFQGIVRMVSSSEYIAVTEQNEILTFVNEHARECTVLAIVAIIALILIWLFFFVRKWSKISREARKRLDKNSDYAEIKSIRRIRRASHAKMIANVFLGLFIINVILCIIGYLTAYYGSRLSQFSQNEQILPELVSAFINATPTVDEIFEFLNLSVFFAGCLLLVTILLQFIAGKLRKRADNSVFDAEKQVQEQKMVKEEKKEELPAVIEDSSKEEKEEKEKLKKEKSGNEKGRK